VVRARVRLALIAIAIFLLSCGPPHRGSRKKKSTERDETAAERARREAKEAGELDDPSANKWGAWRYEGDRDTCQFVVGRRCFTKRVAACQAAKCKAPKQCETEGAGPATVKCE
jgi:hypothetical protein